MKSYYLHRSAESDVLLMGENIVDAIEKNINLLERILAGNRAIAV